MPVKKISPFVAVVANNDDTFLNTLTDAALFN